MALEDPRRAIGDWLDRYEQIGDADPAQMSALKSEIRKMNWGQLEKFAAWLEERHQLREQVGETEGAQPAALRGFGLQAAAAAEVKRKMSLPGLRFIRAGL